MPFLHDIERNTLYFIKLFAEAADDRMPEPSNAAYVNAQKDVYDVLIEQVREVSIFMHIHGEQEWWLYMGCLCMVIKAFCVHAMHVVW